jgi:hypothetical protein
MGREGFYRAFDMILDRYVDPIEPSDLLARGLKRVVGQLDAYSDYLTADERAAMRSRARPGRLLRSLGRLVARP